MIRPSDIIPVTEVQARLPSLIKQAKQGNRHIIVTQRGRATAVLLDLGEYERLMDLADLGIGHLEERYEDAKKRGSISSEEFREFLQGWITKADAARRTQSSGT